MRSCHGGFGLATRRRSGTNWANSGLIGQALLTRRSDQNAFSLAPATGIRVERAEKLAGEVAAASQVSSDSRRTVSAAPHNVSG